MSVDPWAVPSALALSLVLGLAFHVLRHGSPSRVERPLLGALLGAAVFAFGVFCRFLTETPTTAWLALLGGYGGLMLLVPCWWLVTLAFMERHGAPLRGRAARIAVRVPLALAAFFFLVAVTNPWHELFLTPRPGGMGSDYGPFWFGFALNSFGTIGLSVALLLRLAGRTPSPTARAHARLLALACALPAIGNAIYLTMPRALPFDPTSLGIALAAALFVAGIDRRQLFALSPRLLGEVLREDAEPVLLLDAGGALLHANPAGLAWLGLSEDARPADVPERMAARLRAARDQEPLDPERLRRALLDPERSLDTVFAAQEGRWLRLSSRVLPDRWRRAAVVVVRLRDETELHRTSEALAEQVATLDAVLASSGDGILVVDWPDGRVRYVNRAFVAIVGMQRAPAVGDDAETVRAAVHAAIDDGAALDATIERGVRDPRAVLPLDITTRDGRVVEGSSRGVLRDGAPVARVFQVRDVTEQRRAEDALRLSQKLGSLAEMAGGIAHDFNDLLVSILGNAEAALERLPEEASARAPLRDVEAAARRARGLTQQLRVYSGRSRPEPCEVDLSVLVREVLGALTVSVPPDVRLEKALAASPPAVVGDPVQLRQIASTLVRRGIDALGSARGRVRVETGVAYVSRDARVAGIEGPVTPERPLVFLRVSHDGPAADDGARRPLGEPAGPSEEGAGGGEGGRPIGLAACQGIVRSHGGILQVEDDASGRCVLTVLLPSAGRPLEARPPEAGAEPAWRGEGCVLVVDDEPGVQRAARRILESAGFEVETAADGAEALQRFDERGGGYRAVLLDLSMPRLSGEATAEALRKRDAGLPVLFSSGHPDAEVESSLPRSAFVAKPYARADLLAALRTLLDDEGDALEPRLR